MGRVRLFLRKLLETSIVFRNPRLYLIYLRYFDLRWLYTKAGPYEFLNNRFVLMISSPGHCASIALLAYIKEHNPELKVVIGSHAPALVKYCCVKNIPVIVLSRDMLDYVGSSMSKSKGTPLDHWPMFYCKTVQPWLDHRCVIRARYEDILTTNGLMDLMERVQRKCGKFSQGDFILPHIRTYESSKELA